MKIKLKNFRCYTEREFDFGKEGLILLSGPSGSGKSSILMAILFALYNIGLKLTTVGEKGCEVEIEFENLRIYRRKTPNRLVVTDLITNKQYEDDAGQSVIIDHFGISFQTICYLQQNFIHSFIMMSPSDKLEFLEKTIFQNIDLYKIKNKCASLIQEKNNELVSVSSQLEMCTEVISTLTEPEKVEFPIKTKNIEKTIKNQNTLFKNCKILINKNETKLELVKNELMNRKIVEAKLVSKQEQLEKINKELNQLVDNKKLLSYKGKEDDEKLSNLENKLSNMIFQKELYFLKEKHKQDKERLKLMQNEEIQNIHSEIEKWKNILWQEYSKDEIDSIIEQEKQLIKDIDELNRLKNSLEVNKVDKNKIEENKKLLEKSKKEIDLKKDLYSKLLLQKQVYKCPCCSSSLQFEDNVLKIYKNEIISTDIDDENLKKEINNLSKVISKLEFVVPSDLNKLENSKIIEKSINKIKNLYEKGSECENKKDVENNIEYLQNYKMVQKDLEKKIKSEEKKIDDKTFSFALNSFKAQVDSQKHTIKSLESKIKEEVIDENEENIRKNIEILRKEKEKFEDIENSIKKINVTLVLLSEEIGKLESEYISKFKVIRNINEIETDVVDCEKNLAELKIKLKEAESNLEKIDKYNTYISKKESYDQWKNKIEILSKNEIDVRDKYSASIMLKEKILQAESIAIENIINNINTHAREYLDIFFPNDPLSAQLLPFKQSKKDKKKETKGTKPQINLEIYYKEMETDITMLSGGELSRVILAFTLAFAEIFNAPMVLLDECTASLDQETTSIVMEGIKENFENKPILVIAHQVVSGDFDRKIQLE